MASGGCSQYSDEFRRMISDDIQEGEVRFKYQHGETPGFVMKSTEDEYSEGFRRMISDITQENEPKSSFLLVEPHEQSIVKPVVALSYVDGDTTQIEAQFKP